MRVNALCDGPLKGFAYGGLPARVETSTRLILNFTAPTCLAICFSRFRLLPFGLPVAALLAMTSPVQAAILYWDGDGKGTVSGGTGTWSTSMTLSLWSFTSGGSSSWAWVNANTDHAVFQNSAVTGVGAGFVEITENNVKYTFPVGTKNFARLKVTGP